MATSSELYISWNNALVDYFITTSTSTVFYVTKSKIEDIGKKYNIEKDEEESYIDCFIHAISFFVEKSNSAQYNSKGRIKYRTLRNDLFSKLHIEGYTTQISKDDLLSNQFKHNNATLLDFAVFLTKHTIFVDLHSKTKLEFAYFSYVIFILLGFNSSEGREWKGVEKIFTSNNIYFSDKERGKVKPLFEALIHNNILTPLCVQTQDPYIKYLKYHSVLRSTDRSLFEKILYDNHIQWDCNMAYGDLRNLIWRVGIRNTNQYRNLREELLKAATRPYFETLIKEFNREQYALERLSEASAGNNTPIKRGKFRFVVDYRSQSSQIWLQYLQPDCAVSNNDITLTHIHKYVDNCRVDVKNPILWADYVSNGLKYQDSDYFVDSSQSSDFYFFEIIEGVLLAEMVEPEQLVGKACFLVIRANSENRQIIKYHNAQPIDKSRLPVFGNGWDIYYVPQYEPKQMEINFSDSQETQVLRYAQICFDNCIAINKKTYLLEAFPYIVTEGINDPLREVGILICDIDGQNVGFKKKSVGKRIYLYDFDTVPCGEIKVTITVDGIEESRSFRVICNTQVDVAINKPCARFDKWGCLNNTLQDEYYSDNLITSKSNKVQISEYMPSKSGYNKESKQPYHRLMAILYSIGNNTSKYKFTSKDLDNILIYLAGFDGEKLTEWDVKRIKDTLRDLGIVTHYYENGKYLYETNTPRLIPLKEGRHIYNGNNEQVTGELMLYLLYGTYSQVMYEYLYTTVDHLEYKPLSISCKLNKYIPSYIVVGLGANQSFNTIQVCNTSFVDDLLLFAGKVSELDQDEDVFKTYNYNDNTSRSYPKMVPSPYKRGRKELLRLSQNYVLDNDNLSPNLLRTYIRYKHNEPVWYVDRGLHQTKLYFKSRWQLPFYIRKALVAQNSALQKDLYAFGIDDILGTDSKDRLFCEMYMYECSKQCKKNVLDVLGGLDTKQVEIVSYGLKMVAIKSTENGLDSWHLELYMNDKLRCYTKHDHDRNSEKVFYISGSKQIEVMSNKEGCNLLNAKLSAVLHLIMDCSTSRFNENEWINNYLIVAQDRADIPALNSGEEHEVKIFKLEKINRKN